MKLLSYKVIRPGFQALGSISVRVRLRSPLSHTEVMFEPGDGVDHLMPDGTCEPDENGAYWVASSVASDKLPDWSKKRAGKTGGVRFKRVVPDETKWMIQEIHGFDPVKTATWFVVHEGEAYDWKHILSFIAVGWNWVFRQSMNKYTCTEACGAALGFTEAENLDPKNLPPVIERINRLVVDVLNKYAALEIPVIA